MSGLAEGSLPTRAGQLLIDGQVTLASTVTTPQVFLEYQARNAVERLSAFGIPGSVEKMTERLLRLYSDPQADRLVAEMDAAGVGHAIVMAPSYRHAVPVAASQEDIAELYRGIIRRHPGRFTVFWGVDPRDNEDDFLLTQTLLQEEGFGGIKLYPPCGYSPSDERLDRYFALCADLHLPVCSHSGPGWGPLDFSYAQPLLLDSAARRFPGVDFIFGHGAVFGTAECVAIAAHRPNVYLESSGFSSAPSADGWPAHLNSTFRLGVQHKMIFGTGWPSYRLTESMASLCAAVVDGDEVFDDVSDAARALILGGNARRLLTQADR